ncbi:hypothetical protein BDA96_02G274600 [Sorghum bicolor]|uniref:Uncharacterized protein n=1 Tax=Sorghum bicolor TaxID=4558 RepID=A0A921RQS2_SORBI|nr:hypothetical protein BDA96_02G274600 [Sorghum bicolor]
MCSLAKTTLHWCIGPVFFYRCSSSAQVLLLVDSDWGSSTDSISIINLSTVFMDHDRMVAVVKPRYGHQYVSVSHFLHQLQLTSGCASAVANFLCVPPQWPQVDLCIRGSQTTVQLYM